MTHSLISRVWRRPTRRGSAIASATIAASALLLTGCSNGDDFGAPTNGEDVDNGESSAVDSLPTDVQPAYENLNQPVGSTPYVDDWQPEGEAPFTIGYASPYDGNSWQANAKDRLFEELLPAYQDAGLVEDIILVESGGDDSVQNQQIRQLADQGVDLIITCCSNTTALNQSIEYAYNQGVPFVSYSGYVDSPYAINTSANYHQAGYTQADAIFEKLGGEGTVLNVIGVAGAASSDSFDAGVREAAEEYPDINLVGQVEGGWSDTVTKSEVQTYLATNSGQIDGLVVQPGSATGALEALKESGRPIVPISIGGEAGALCYWVNNPDYVDTAFNIWPPGNEMQLGFEVGIRTLQEQGPKIQSVVREVTPITHEFAEEELGSDCNERSNDWVEPTPEEWFPPEMLDMFFEDPADPLDP